VEDSTHGPWHARSRCHDCWCALVQRESRASVQARTQPRRLKLFREARNARLVGDMVRHRYIMKHGALPEEQIRHGIPRGSMSLMGQVLERTFVSDIEMDNGTGAWLGFQYFGDVSRAEWVQLERYGLGGRNTTHSRRR
jgi:hypothetical protein